jgi:hypothetical protein
MFSTSHARYNNLSMAHMNTETLQAALAGYQQQMDAINTRMAEIRSILGGKAPAPAGSTTTGKPRRKISAAGRARIAAAQRKRWAGSRGPAKAAKPSKPAKAKRRLSAAGRAAIVAATKKRWAAVRAAKAKTS